MSFLYPSMLAGPLLLLIGVPILIHLINLMRHRRVRWAAMDFLLQSQKRNRKRIALKQILLLAIRTAAVAALLLMLAQPILQNQWGELLGGTKTHHIVLLDDSFSMSDRGEGTSAFDRAKRFLHELVEKVSDDPGIHDITLLRFSQAMMAGPDRQFDLIQETINAEFHVTLESHLGRMHTSQTDGGPIEALEVLARQPRAAEDEQRLIYLVSDFRSNQWEDGNELRTSLRQLAEAGGHLHLVHCVDNERPNLGITHLAPNSGTPAAGVELLMQLSVKNFGNSVARQVNVEFEEDGYARPGLVIDQIKAGETVSRIFRVNFPTAGQHKITASLPDDAIAIDNWRYHVLEMPDAVPILLLDSSPRARDAFFLASALAPGGSANTGLSPRIEGPAFLRNHDTLHEFAAIFVLNLERLDEAEIEALEDYVRSGGGVGFFMGERCRHKFFNEKLYRDGQGLFPVPLTVPTDLLVDRLQKSADLVIYDHPVFAVFAGQRNTFLDRVVVERYFGVPHEWTPDSDPATTMIARLRNGAPFVVERRFGEGRVVAFLSKASPEDTSVGVWNNWGRNNPSFVVTILELQGYLSQQRDSGPRRLVGQPLTVELDPKRHDQVGFKIPAAGHGQAVETQTAPDALKATLAQTPVSGFYQAVMIHHDGRVETRAYAYNVASQEGDLRMFGQDELATQLNGIPYRFHRVEDLHHDPELIAGFNLSDALLGLLIVLLVGEQIVAYSASYHPPTEVGKR